MTADSVAHERYALSFGSGALLSREALIAAELYLQEQDWAQVRKRLEGENLLQLRTVSSVTRQAREIVQRLSVLTAAELDLLIDASPSERGHLLWIAACRRYAFIGDFAEEVLRERFQLLIPILGHEEFDSFVHGKALWHPELTRLKESTLKKLRQTIFRMLTEAGLLANGEIVQAVLSERILSILNAQQPSDIRFLPARHSMGVTL